MPSDAPLGPNPTRDFAVDGDAEVTLDLSVIPRRGQVGIVAATIEVVHRPPDDEWRTQIFDAGPKDHRSALVALTGDSVLVDDRIDRERPSASPTIRAPRT